MSEQETNKAPQEQNHPTPEIEDLTIDQAQADEVKGGSGNNTWAGNIHL